MCKLSPARRAGGSLLLVLALGACSNDDEPTVTPPTTAVRGGGSSTSTPTSSTTSTPPTVRTERFEVAGGIVAGGSRTIEAGVGEQLRIVVRTDAADEVHLHGYDIRAAASPGVDATLDVTTNIPGKFELELEDSGLKLGELEVR